MSQQINLLGPAFRKQHLLLSATTAAACLAIVVVTLLAAQFFLSQQVKRLTGELKSAQTTLKERQAQVEKFIADSAKRKKDAALEAEIARFEFELKLGRESIQALKGGALGNQQGFSEYMRAFSRQSITGLWLTGFIIAGAGDISIRGRVTQPDLVPSYIQRLNREKIFQGRTFATLEMHMPKGDPAGAAGGKDQNRTSRYLEFSLTTADTVGAVASAGKAQ